MKTTGISRCIDELGRVVIPKSIRKKLAIEEGDPLEFKIEDGSIVITPDKSRCTFCLSEGELIKFKGKVICKSCIDELNA